MGVRSLVSFGFVLIPIAVTISVLLGIQAYRESKGLPSNPFVDNRIKSSLYCQKAFGVTPYTNGQQYTLNPNQWALPDDYTGPGGLCMNVTTFDNGSYPTKTSAAEWSITWQFPRGPPTQPVHAFPNIKMDSSVFPIEISQVSAINFETEWYYGVGNDRPDVMDIAALTAAALDANVAVDMFLDSDPDKATDTVQAKYEVMIWLGQFGASTQQIGLPEGAIATQVVNGTTFSLYSGVNGLGQSVLTWVASTAATGVQSFNADIGPLLQGLTGLGGPTVNDYLGYIAFGSETLDSGSNVTFYNKVLSMDVIPA
ncbi:uncharacterized protein PV07_06745 [Cladophialophora immunda]|uniref:xyloglucan-specific endo-beta-1,4-glucanase n=1 Tax=Cladophialophora immunda TaxID=569365 RepID=A0A0D2APF1_9EURO|nr:uncharacterized protein PV07_06745 [Cladophialophora immunda]KIW26962.1 hypothetical protein PV07_06745 [Cladophialophora immunda]OQV03953.1 hypothetical protein CLAIMM_08918 isoform 1 [Cladophialophora immunda]